MKTVDAQLRKADRLLRIAVVLTVLGGSMTLVGIVLKVLLLTGVIHD